MFMNGTLTFDVCMYEYVLIHIYVQIHEVLKHLLMDPEW